MPNLTARSRSFALTAKARVANGGPGNVTLISRSRSFNLTAYLRSGGGFNLASAASVFPNPVQQLVAETISWVINAAAIIPSGDSITSIASTTVYDTTVPGTRTSVATPTSTVASPNVTFPMATGTLVAGHTYSVIIVCVITAAYHIAIEIDLVCPY